MRTGFFRISRVSLAQAGWTLGSALVVSALLLAPTAAAQDLAGLASAAGSSPRDADAQSRYGLALLADGQYRLAKTHLQRAARLERTGPRLFDVARVAFAEGNYRRARSSCNPLRRVDPALHHVCRARAFLVNNRSGRAFEELESAVVLNPNHYETQLALGDAHRLRNNVSEAEAGYRRASSLGAREVAPRLGLALLYANANRESDAITQLRDALTIDPSDAETQYQLGLRTSGEEALRLLRGSTAARPHHAAAQAALGDAELAAGNHDAAKGAFEKVIELDENNAAAHAGLGQVALAASDPETAMTRFERSLEIVPNQPRLHVLIGETHEAAGRNAAAYASYRRAAAMSGGDVSALIHAAELALRQNRDTFALGFIEPILRAQANHAHGLFLKGEVMRARGDRSAARQLYQRAQAGEGELDRARLQASIAALEQTPSQRRLLSNPPR